MLQIKVPPGEFFDQETSEFIETKGVTLVMEHSLISISKWEEKWHKPYLSDDPKTSEETLDYLRCMTVSPSNVDPLVYRRLTSEDFKRIDDYISDPMTATTVRDIKKYSPSKKRIITAEVIYSWMIALNISKEYEKWHINKLITLIKVCSIENDPNPKKMSKKEISRQNREINKARRARYKTRG